MIRPQNTNTHTYQAFLFFTVNKHTLVTNCYKLNKEKACLIHKKSVYYIVRFERVRGWVQGHTEMTNDLQVLMRVL